MSIMYTQYRMRGHQLTLNAVSPLSYKILSFNLIIFFSIYFRLHRWSNCISVASPRTSPSLFQAMNRVELPALIL